MLRTQESVQQTQLTQRPKHNDSDCCTPIALCTLPVLHSQTYI